MNGGWGRCPALGIEGRLGSKLHLSVGCESLFAYCTQILHLSNSEAFHRITAARVARKFPLVFQLIEQRDLHLTAVCLLRDYLTPGGGR